jgi:hypothetical protein
MVRLIDFVGCTNHGPPAWSWFPPEIRLVAPLFKPKIEESHGNIAFSDNHSDDEQESISTETRKHLNETRTVDLTVRKQELLNKSHIHM